MHTDTQAHNLNCTPNCNPDIRRSPEISQMNFCWPKKWYSAPREKVPETSPDKYNKGDPVLTLYTKCTEHAHNSLISATCTSQPATKFP